VFLADVESMNILDVNEAAVELYGYPYDKLIKMKVPELSAEPTETETALKQLRPTVIPIRHHRKKDTTVFPVEITANYFDLDGRKINISAIRDISRRIEYEKEKEILETQLRQSHKMESIGNLAGGIAHDFNNILSAIIGYTELSLEDVEKGTHMEDQLQKVYMAGNRAKDLVKQILAFARQSGEEIKPMRVDNITKEVLKFLRSSIPTTIEINQEIDSESLIMGNATQVHQVLMNLCTNAAHAMEDAGGMLQVGLKDVLIDDGFHVKGRELKPGDYLKLTVSDTGTGIAPEIMETIFDPYFTTKGPGEGSGLGLAMVHGIVETYGGTVSVESVLGKGTVFSIYLPVAEKLEIHHEIASEPLSSGTERILFVDDEAPIVDAGGQILERLGYSVTTRTSSVEALELFRSKPNDFDLVITDMTMPNMTGDTLSVELMKIRPGIPVILCTGYSKKITDKAASAMGIKGFAYKPIVKADLAKTVREVLDGR
jgi:PAS domain S-box-containing protein